MMKEQTNPYVKQLWITYKIYCMVSKGKDYECDSNEYATKCTLGYLEYVDELIKNYPEWEGHHDDIVLNQVRILRGFIECYDRPVKKDKLVHKTRWSL